MARLNRRSRLGRIGRFAGTLLVALLLTVATLFVVVETEWFKNWLRRQAGV